MVASIQPRGAKSAEGYKMENEARTPPGQAAPNIIAAFFTGYIPGVESEYELLTKACNGSPQLSLPDLQMEVLILGLHCLDRAVFIKCGVEYRDAFMDHALTYTEQFFATALPESTLQYLRDLYNARQREYATMPPLPEKDAFADRP